MEDRTYQYPAIFAAAEEGGFVITFPDIPEAITQGENVSDAIEQGADALEEAIIGRINTGDPLPLPSKPTRGQFLIPVPAQTALKAALYEEVRARSTNKVELAAQLGIDEKEVRRLLDPHHPSKLVRIAEVLERIGKHIVIGIRDDKALAAGR